MMQFVWCDIQALGVQGAGWQECATAFTRLPAHAEGLVTEAVWQLSRQSTGLYVDFVSDASELHARTRLRQPPAQGQEYIKYLDLYCRDERGAWRWAGVSRYGFTPTGETPLIEGIPGRMRTWRLYLPLTYEVERLEVGIPDGATIAPVPVETRRPIVIYGTSIVHGCGHLSRPGMVWPSIMARRLDWPLVNLGFSGSARCELPLAEIIAELDPVAFLIDPLANMNLDQVAERAEPFLRILLRQHPTTPFLLIEDRTHAQAWLLPEYRPAQQRKQAQFRDVADTLCHEGARIHYLAGANLIGDDGEGTTDGSHPSDLGAMRYADCVTPLLNHIVTTPQPARN